MNPSKELNLFFGDRTGRSISRRTAHGFKDVTGLNITDRDSEFLMHTVMIGTFLGLNSSKSQTRTAANVGLGALFLLYHAGRRY